MHPTRITASQESRRLVDWPETDVLAFVQGGEFWTLDINGGEPQRLMGGGTATLRFPAVSPNGRWIAYVETEPEDELWREIFVRPYPDPEGAVYRVTPEGGTAPVWSHDSKELYFRSFRTPQDRSKMMAMRFIEEGAAFRPEDPRELFDRPTATTVPHRNYDVAPDGRFFMSNRSQRRLHPVTALRVVDNWFEVLKQRVPTGR